jgi:hypothetical protein
VISFVKPEGGKLSIGANVIFKGYITFGNSLDETGELGSVIDSKTLLLAVYAKSLGG